MTSDVEAPERSVSSITKQTDKPAPRKHEEPTGEVKRIGEMLSYRRAHDSEGEKEFVERFIMPLKPAIIISNENEVYGYKVVIHDKDGKTRRRAFCAHVDSVHNRTLTHTRQSVGYDATRKEFYVSDTKQRDCLGADDAAGCYVLLRMIEAKVPGLYMFFRGEERGGIGSSGIVEDYPTNFEGIDYAIQFDRRGTESIITDMMCGTTCSDEFAMTLAAELGMGHKVDRTGSFTDTATIAALVPECTNVSVGYDFEHSSNEVLDTDYLLDLADACVRTFSRDDLDLPLMRKANDFGDSNSYTSPMFSYDRGPLPPSDLVWLSHSEISKRAMKMSFEELVDALYDAGIALADAYENDPSYWIQ